MRRPCADREEKRVTHGRDMRGRSIAMRHVTKASSMPTGRKPQGDRAMTNAERQARYRARHAAVHPAPPTTSRPSRPVDRRSRPQRWRDAVAELLALQAEYADWVAAMPQSLRDSPTAQALEAIVGLDLNALTDVDTPRGYGRD